MKRLIEKDRHTVSEGLVPVGSSCCLLLQSKGTMGTGVVCMCGHSWSSCCL